MLERKFENTYEIEIQNGMTFIHENIVNITAQCNLLHDILNPYKHENFIYPLLYYSTWVY